MNNLVNMSGFRELSMSEVMKVCGGHYEEELTDEYIQMRMALQTLTIGDYNTVMDAMTHPSPMGSNAGDPPPGYGPEIVVTAGYQVNIPTGWVELTNIVADLIRDQLWDTLSELAEIFETAGIFDIQFLENLNDDDGVTANTQTEHNCEQNAVGQVVTMINAATAFDGFRGTSQPEYGATVAASGGSFVTSALVTGESYSSAAPDAPETGLRPPAGYGWADVIAMIHSHPPSGSNTLDIRNQAPSDGDWLAADNAVARHADPTQLTLYITDANGDTRAYDYQTSAERGATSSNPSGNMDNASAANGGSGGSC